MELQLKDASRQERRENNMWKMMKNKFMDIDMLVLIGLFWMLAGSILTYLSPLSDPTTLHELEYELKSFIIIHLGTLALFIGLAFNRLTKEKK